MQQQVKRQQQSEKGATPHAAAVQLPGEGTRQERCCAVLRGGSGASSRPPALLEVGPQPVEVACIVMGCQKVDATAAAPAGGSADGAWVQGLQQVVPIPTCNKPSPVPCCHRLLRTGRGRRREHRAYTHISREGAEHTGSCEQSGAGSGCPGGGLACAGNHPPIHPLAHSLTAASRGVSAACRRWLGSLNPSSARLPGWM